MKVQKVKANIINMNRIVVIQDEKQLNMLIKKVGKTNIEIIEGYDVSWVLKLMKTKRELKELSHSVPCQLNKGTHDKTRFLDNTASQLVKCRTHKQAIEFLSDTVNKLIKAGYEKGSIVHSIKVIKRLAVSKLDKDSNVYLKRLAIVESFRSSKMSEFSDMMKSVKEQSQQSKQKNQSNLSMKYNSNIDINSLFQLCAGWLEKGTIHEKLLACMLFTGRRTSEVCYISSFEKYDEYNITVNELAKKNNRHNKALSDIKDSTVIVPCLHNVDEVLKAVNDIQMYFKNRLNNMTANEAVTQVNNWTSSRCFRIIQSIRDEINDNNKALTKHGFRGLYTAVCMTHIRGTEKQNKILSNSVTHSAFCKDILGHENENSVGGYQVFENSVKTFDVSLMNI
jgi:hypothetical protein